MIDEKAVKINYALKENLDYSDHQPNAIRVGHGS